MLPRRLAARLLLLLASALLSVALLEVVVRLLDLAPDLARIEIDTPHGRFVTSDNPVLRYVPKPGARDINAYGIRDVERPTRKPRGRFRVVVLGDSVGFGYCNEAEVLAIERLFPRRVEDRLSAAGTQGVDVFNLSVSGYDTTQEVELLATRGLALEPDLVIVAYSLNDAYVASAELATLERNPAYRAQRALAHSLFVESHLVRVLWLSTRRGEATVTTGRPRRVDLAFDRLRLLGEQHGFDVLVVIFPFLEANSPAWERQHEITRQRARERGFDVLDLLPVYSEAAPEGLAAMQGRCNLEHPDERGHEVAAQAIAEWLGDRAKTLR
jgi:lysophospholipase L1-like esterase